MVIDNGFHSSELSSAVQSIDIVGLELVFIHISLFIYRMMIDSYCLHYFRGMWQIKSQHGCE